MQTIYQGNFEDCIAFIHSEQEKDETLEFDLVQSDISETFYYVKELSGWDCYQGSF